MIDELRDRIDLLAASRTARNDTQMRPPRAPAFAIVSARPALTGARVDSGRQNSILRHLDFADAAEGKQELHQILWGIL